MKIQAQNNLYLTKSKRVNVNSQKLFNFINYSDSLELSTFKNKRSNVSFKGSLSNQIVLKKLANSVDNEKLSRLLELIERKKFKFNFSEIKEMTKTFNEKYIPERGVETQKYKNLINFLESADDEVIKKIKKRNLISSFNDDITAQKQFFKHYLAEVYNASDEQFKQIEVVKKIANKRRDFSLEDLAGIVGIKPEKINQIKKFIYIEGRNPQLSGYNLKMLSDLTNAQFKKIEKYIHNKEKQLSILNICNLAELKNEEFAQIKKYIGNKNCKLNDWELIELAKLKPGDFKKIEPYIINPNSHFNAQDLETLLKLKPEEFNKIKNYFSRSSNYLSGEDYSKLAKLEPQKFNQIKDFINIKDRQRQLSMEDLLFWANSSPEFYAKAKKFIHIPNNIQQLNVNEIKFLVNFDANNLLNFSFKENVEQLGIIKFIILKIENNEFIKKHKLDLYGIKNKILKVMLTKTEPIEISLKTKQDFFNNVIGINNPKAIDIIKNMGEIIDKYGKNGGFPLEYKRKDFTQDLTEILNKCPQKEQNEILQKLGINLTKDKLGYDGMLNLNKLDEKNPTEVEIKKLVIKFLLNNKVATGDKNVDNFMNSLIKALPEFVNVIGKRHHGIHKYSIDGHILKVLQETVNHPKFESLSNYDKMCLQLAVIFHDIGKSEGVIDTGHEFLSSIYTNDILKKFNLPENTKDRISEIVKYHNWNARLQTGYSTEEEIAVMFRNKNDITLAEIFAKADLLGISKEFYDSHIQGFDKSIQKINKKLQKFYEGGNVIFSTKILNNSKIPQIEYNGHKYKVIDFTKISDDEDLFNYGLSVHKKK